MKFSMATSLGDLERMSVHELWNIEYPDVIRHASQKETDAYLDKLENTTHEMVDHNGEMIAWFCDFDRDEKRFFVMIIAREYHGLGLGSELLNRAKSRNAELYGWIVMDKGYVLADGTAYPSPENFYRKNGFSVLKDVVSKTHILNTVQIKWEKSAGNKG